jgi:integrase
VGVKIKKLRGKWYLVIDYRNRRKTKVIGSDRKLAETVRREVEARLALGDFGIFEDKSAEMTFGDYEAKWETQYVDTKVKRSTAARYKSVMALHVLPRFKDVPLVQISRDSLKDFFAEMGKGDLAGNSIQNVLIAFRVALQCAFEDGLILVNPAAKLGRFLRKDEAKFEAVFLTRQEADSFLAAIQSNSPEHYPLFLLFLRTGMRLGEALALQWGDVQFGKDETDANRFIWIRRNYTAGEVTTPKSNKSRRVDMSRVLRRVLYDLREQRLLKAFKSGKDDISEELVFPNEAGGYLDPSNLHKRVFRPGLTTAELRSCRIHDLRHSYASLLLQDGASITYVRDQLGHSSIQVTVDLYGHLVPSANIGFVDKLDEMAETSPQKSANQTQTQEQGSKTPDSEALQVMENVEDDGGPGQSRTADQRFRKPLLYPSELQGRLA